MEPQAPRAGGGSPPRHVGLDLDNTIIGYDRAFHALALERGLIPPDLPPQKQAVRDALRRLPDGEARWVDLQALAYGPEIGRAEVAPGLPEFLSACRQRGVAVSIISHKTRFAAGTPRSDLHRAALDFLARTGLLDPERYGLSAAAIGFHERREEKIAAIRARGCSHFVDDLLEVLLEDAFPAGVSRLLFGGARPADLPAGLLHVGDFHALRRLLLP